MIHIGNVPWVRKYSHAARKISDAILGVLESSLAILGTILDTLVYSFDVLVLSLGVLGASLGMLGCRLACSKRTRCHFACFGGSFVVFLDLDFAAPCQCFVKVQLFSSWHLLTHKIYWK